MYKPKEEHLSISRNTNDEISPQKLVEKLVDDGFIHNITALRVLLILSDLLKESGVPSKQSIEFVFVEKSKMTGQNLPEYWINRSFSILEDYMLAQRFEDEDAVKITQNGIEVVAVLHLPRNKKRLEAIMPPPCRYERFLETTKLHFAMPHRELRHSLG